MNESVWTASISGLWHGELSVFEQESLAVIIAGPRVSRGTQTGRSRKVNTLQKLLLIASALVILICGDISVITQDKVPNESAMLAASKCDVATAKNFFTNDIRKKALAQYKGDMLRVAVEVNCTELFDFLLAIGANVNAKAKNGGDTPLMIAALFGRANLAKRLLAAGADVNS
jgi:ankyrin repeat protein